MSDRTVELALRLTAARAAATSLVRASRRLLVAADSTVSTSRTLVAHAVPDIGELSATKGLSLCERLAGDEVVVVPDLSWDAVPATQRCPECERSLQATG